MNFDALLDFELGFSTQDGDDQWLPTAADASEGYDVRCCLATPDASGPPPASITLQPGDEATVGTGLYVTRTFPKHVAMLVLPRSSTGKRSITIRNSPGLVDRAYVGREIKLMLRNDGREPQTVSHGERIAQLVFVLCAHPSVVRTPPIDPANLGREGFGSTGRF
ncbi:MAG: dUTP diphosphatase [Gemmatimonadota bacterium]|nr:dUTP diphosphatase [Gemmatimonadota bacterium]